MIHLKVMQHHAKLPRFIELEHAVKILEKEIIIERKKEKKESWKEMLCSVI